MLHLPDHGDDCCHEDSNQSHHDTEDCPICQTMLVRFAKYVVEPRAIVVLAEEFSSVAPSNGTAFPQFRVPAVLAPRPPPLTEA
jgi:hypothetical protein